MLKAHLDAVEASILAKSKIPSNSGHSNHKGTPREIFVREFLSSHLPSNFAVGTGEIIDCNSNPNQSRNQHDIVIYRTNYPKLDFGGDIYGFLSESVVATIEVKSTLTASGVDQAIVAAKNTKQLEIHVVKNIQIGYVPPKILNYVVAYDGPEKMSTVSKWVTDSQSRHSIYTPDLPLEVLARTQTPSPSLDGIFILGKGYFHFDNHPFAFVDEKQREIDPEMKWIHCDSSSSNLLMLFLFLQTATSNINGALLNPVPYLSRIHLAGVAWTSYSGTSS